jgi:RNA polymerase sigma-70 factor (ECF subfamily)
VATEDVSVPVAEVPPDPKDGHAELVTAFQAHFDAIYRYASRRVGPDAAEDVASETFVRALRLWDTYQAERGSLEGWLYGIATNVAREHDRARRYGQGLLVRLGNSRGREHVELDAADRLADSDRVTRAVAELRPRIRDAVTLVAGVGLSYEEAARALHVPVGTVRSRLATGRRLLQASLTENRADEVSGEGVTDER